MSTAFSAKLPKIILDTPPTIQPPQFLNSAPVHISYTIDLTYKHFAGGSLDFDWPEEFAADFVAADNKRTLIRKFNGYRFYMNLTVTDKYLTHGAGQAEQEEFEMWMHELSQWGNTPGRMIYVYPWNDIDTCYLCRATVVKTLGQDDDQPKTCWHNYQISLLALQLIQTKPTPSYTS